MKIKLCNWSTELNQIQIINFFQKNDFLKNSTLYIFHHLLYYCSETIQNVDCDHFDNFQHVTFIFSQNLISLF
jgi:hypothetical protein